MLAELERRIRLYEYDRRVANEMNHLNSHFFSKMFHLLIEQPSQTNTVTYNQTFYQLIYLFQSNQYDKIRLQCLLDHDIQIWVTNVAFELVLTLVLNDLNCI